MNSSLKIFLTVGILMTAASWGLTTYTVQLYQEFQDRERNSALETETRNSAGRIEKKISAWQSELRSTLPYILSADENVTNSSLDRYLSEHAEFASIQVFTVPNEKSSHLDQIGRGFTDASDKRLEGKTKTVWEREVHKATRAWLRKSIRDSKDSSFGIENIYKETSVPLVAFAFRSKISGSELHSWIVVAAWQDALLRDLVRGLDTESLIVTKKGEIITAHDKKFAKGGSYRSNPGFRSAVGKPGNVGISESYAKGAASFVAAFAQIPELDLIVITEKDLSSALTQAKTIEEGNWLWLAAILVGAFVLSMIAGNGVDKAYRPVNAILERFSTGKFAVDEIAKGPAAEMVLRLTDLGHILQAKFAAKKAEAKPTGSSLASHLRHTLIPQTDIKRPGLTVSGYYQPAKECGGVLWGHKSLSDTHEFVYMIDDAEVGEPAALNMGLFYSTINTWLLDATHRAELSTNPSLFISFLMELLRNHPTVTSSLAAQAVVIDNVNNRLLYCGTGQVATLIVSNTDQDTRAFESLGDFKTRVIAMKTGKDPITARGAPVNAQETPLLKNDRIVLFSKGLIDSKDPDGRPWGFGNCIAAFQDHSDQSAKEFKTEVLAHAFTFYRSTAIADDIAFVAIEFHGANKAVANAPATQPATSAGPKDDFGAFAISESKMTSSAVTFMPPPPPPPVMKPQVTKEQTGSLPPPPPLPVAVAGEEPEMPVAAPAEETAEMPPILEVDDIALHTFSLDLAGDEPAPPEGLPEIPELNGFEESAAPELSGLDESAAPEFAGFEEPEAPDPDASNLGVITPDAALSEEAELEPPEPAEPAQPMAFQDDELTLAEMDPSQIEHPFTERPSQIRILNGLPEEPGSGIDSYDSTENGSNANKRKSRYKIKLPGAS